MSKSIKLITSLVFFILLAKQLKEEVENSQSITDKEPVGKKRKRRIQKHRAIQIEMQKLLGDNFKLQKIEFDKYRFDSFWEFNPKVRFSVYACYFL